MTLYPVNLDIRGQLCLVVGGGLVAKRKVEGLLACGPRIVVISPELCEGLTVYWQKRQIEWKQREYRTKDLEGVKLVFAATDDNNTQQRIAKEAHQREIPVNVITDPESCSFQVPAMFRQGELLITIATSGASPALAARIRKELEARYGREYGQLLILMAAIRKQIISASDDPAHHKLLFEKLLDSDTLKAIETADWERLQTTLAAILPPDTEVGRLIHAIQIQENASMGTLSC
ncbi:MAG: bifunctional precorrin-2 dehydrogenase/sirohydrochlorin ferrochelatase [Desulfocapsa sp.]|nr:MAG: bifunctional precorrin-2 dehydrogenase/sirohydrochlorin ferrochelatase [Desulfocapsa sp.]